MRLSPVVAGKFFIKPSWFDPVGRIFVQALVWFASSHKSEEEECLLLEGGRGVDGTGFWAS